MYTEVNYMPDGTNTGKMVYCKHRAVLLLNRRIRSSMIDDQFIKSSIDAFIVKNRMHAEMKRNAIDYLNCFQNWHDNKNSIGYAAKVGESRIKAIKDSAIREREKLKHNSFGLGKTHLTSAIAMDLIRKGHIVLAVRDVDLMNLLMNLKRSEENGYESYISKIINVPVLMWDDIGKSNPSEAKQSAYYAIIDSRNRQNMPILWSTNEDLDTLSDRIGDGAASRLIGMTKYLTHCEGEDWRLKAS